MKNPKDYNKARGVMLLKKYLPEVAPFEKMAIISSAEEWETIRSQFGKFVVQRVDFPIGMSTKCSFAGTSGYPDDLPRALKMVQAENPNGVILVMDTKETTVPRYLYDGGFNAVFSTNKSVTIDFVGKGFDGGELTKGLAVHEHFEIPWKEVLFIRNRADILRISGTFYRHVYTDKYAEQRKARVEFLIKQCGYEKELVEAHIPKNFKPLYNYLISDFMENIVVPLVTKAPEMSRVDGLKIFGVQGNFVRGKVQPFEIFIPDRW
ncbi:hypothetical protein IKH83_00865 [Candidatus Saccharibacteria bacterium]|nr:hypothetical protein [Candidatus Saccharibacteria bacterium]